MGDDTIFPLAELSEKAIIVLVKTSNQKGSVIQDLILENDLPLWRYVLDLVINRWNYNGNMIPVLSSNCECSMAGIRTLIPENMPILLAGVGAQNGNYSNLSLLLNKNKNGVFVNSSRGILYPDIQKPWRVAIEDAVIELKNNLNKAGGRYE
jgi:orotidine-5'-phosphate decarboxylase